MERSDTMATHTPPSARQPTIRISRSIGLLRAIAIGSSITIGVGVFLFIDLFLLEAQRLTPQGYLVAVVLFIPVVLTYAERAVITPGSGGPFALVRTSGSTWRSYLSGWLLLGGHLALLALLGWGAALYMRELLRLLLGISVDTSYLAPAVIVLVAINDLIGTRGGWRVRLLVVYSSILFLVVVGVLAWSVAAVERIDQLGTGADFGLLRVVALMAAMLWGVHLVLDSRDEMSQPNRNLLPALMVPLVLAGGLGALIASAELRSAGLLTLAATPLSDLVSHLNWVGGAQFETIYLLLGFTISLIGLDRAMVTILRLSGTMVCDGFLPAQFARISPYFGTPIFALHLFAITSALIAAFAGKLLLVGLAAMTFLLVTVLLNAPDALNLQSRLPEDRPLKLPLHPLFPVLATVICVYVVFALPLTVLLVGAGWIALGVIYYTGYARQGNIEVRRRDAVVRDVSTQRREPMYTVMVCTANPETAPCLIRAATVLTRAKRGRMLVMKVASFPDQVPPHIQRQEARHEWDELCAYMQRAGVSDVQSELLVRLAQSPVDGILGTAIEERVNMIVLGWEGEHPNPAYDLGPLIDPVVRAAACDVLVVRGELPERITNILVPTAGSPNTLAAMRLAQELVDKQAGHVVALNLLEDSFEHDSTTMQQAEHRLRQTVNSLGGPLPIEPRVVRAEAVREGILAEVPAFDIMLLGASRGGVLDQAIFGGLPVELARESPRPALLIKHFEGIPRFWARRTWETISAPFPSLTASERADVYQDMRRAARPGVDFFIMIGLAAVIATLGLLLGSPAVIIGAMLVAPLMSPILSLAMSIVQGNLPLLRLDAVATLLGIVLAICVSIVVTLISPTRINTTEILARTEPNLLDLLIALASGAAGGYAVARKEVGTALPGVAIAAALVPPLGVVGYGIGTTQFEIAGGSLLLFTTNLIAIVLAAAIVFLLLGFRPQQAHLRFVVRAGLLGAVGALLLISIPLAFFSDNASGPVPQQNVVVAALNAELSSDIYHVTDVVVQRNGNGFLVEATIYTRNEEVTSEHIGSLEERLSAVTGAPVTLQATVLQAILLPGAPE
jgi:uncharacterized hydrophobic protein (TIGR00271 family)